MKKSAKILFLSLIFTGYFTSCGTETKLEKRPYTNGYVNFPPLQPSEFETFSTEQNSDSVKLVASKDTALRSQSMDSKGNESGESCTIDKGTSLDLKRMFYFYENEQIRVTLNDGIEDCPFSTGYIAYPKFQNSPRIDALIFRIEEGKKNKDTIVRVSDEKAFQESLKHILLVEGTACVNHPNDPGGKTKKGITQYTARANGFKGDVCDIPDSLVHKIYKEKYWDVEPAKHPWPLNLAVMNTCVNSGCGKAKEFVRKIPQDKTVEEQANWFVDQQTAYYHYLTKINTKYNSFIKGWVNRSNHMKDVIASAFDTSTAVSLASVWMHLDQASPMAKAYEPAKKAD